MASPIERRVFKVLHREDEWIIIESGDSEPKKRFKKKKEAVSFSRSYVKNRKPSELRIHTKNSGIHETHIYDEYNPFEKSLRSFFDRLNLLNGLNLFITNQLNIVRKKLLSYKKEDLNEIFSGSVLLLRDITKKYETRFPPFYTSGMFVTKGKDYVSTIDQLCNRESGWCISQAREAFETYLKDTIAVCFQKSLIETDRRDTTRFNNKYFSNRMNPAQDMDYWKKFVRYKFRSKDELFDIVRDLSPGFKNGEMNNYNSLNLQKWHEIVSEVRHAVTHNNFIIKSAIMNNWDNEEKQILTKHFSGIYINKDYLVKITRKEVAYNLRLFTEYGYQIFKFISEKKDYKWEIF